MTNTIGVAVVDPVTMMRESLAALVDRQKDFNLMMSDRLADKLSPTDGCQPLKVVVFGVPLDDEVSLSVRLAMPNGVRAHRVVVLHEVRDYLIAESQKVHVGNLLSVYDPPSAVIRAIKSASDGKRFFGPSIRARIHPGKHGSAVARGTSLVAHEIKLLKAWACGKSSVELSAILEISKSTVQYRKTKLLERLGLRNSMEVLRYAIREKIIEP